MKSSNVVITTVLAGLLSAPCAQAVPNIAVNGIVGAELAPPAGSSQSDSETGEPLVRTVVAVADEQPGDWKYSAVVDITIPKLAIFASVDNTGGGDLLGEFGGEIALLRVNSSLTDTISIVAPSADPYRVTANLEVHGIYTLAGSSGTVVALLDMNPSSPNLSSKTVSKNYTGNGATGDISTPVDVLTVSFDFVGDATFDISSRLFFFVNTIDANANISADFSNTAIINLTVTTLAGAPIPDVVISSSSGNFGTAAPVPVPAALPLLLSALVAGGWRARRRA